ncbi:MULTISPECIES: CDP-diacylglycerol--serine O-phosphatidyltransferase [unclassified Neptuniibacter]|jgi:CDP-diacylglycerol--serine O-phosphatidyltransferase|uniref:CDP-diacylglycerol--serine O-phosphatidyltransferase n=1 Tax=unclassified Neptuniibacter TaxID=2630693 RepID=UPI0025F219DD|nr:MULTISPECIES: CDP-diacylglycerol--serine O-phosphatidyltransferase [unclassified Neptuniibacter]|tara:strand:+ start:6993 stop:7748 length:756 start_codon:yes stop_codon:yes gene_type:complete
MSESQNNDNQEPIKPRSRGIYLLPNLFTTGALFSGFYAVVASMNGHFENAAVAIFVAMVLDGLDGRVARMTNTSSAFGAEYDSLADMVSFGVAPSLVVFNWVLDDIGKLGWFAAFLYVAGAALRLARFNTQIGSTDKRYFIGLPSPAAAAAVAGLVWAATEYEVDGAPYAYLVAGYVALVGVLMVSNVLYYSFKDVSLKEKVPFLILAGIVLALAVISISPPVILWIIFLAYAVSGPLLWVMRKTKQKPSA